MDSDDLYDSYEDSYTDGSSNNQHDDNDNDNDDGLSDNDFDDNTIVNRQKNYAILTEEDIHQRQEADITEVSGFLSISRDSACMLLRRYSWIVSEVMEAWFADEENVCKAVGLLVKTNTKPLKPREVCGICFDSYSLERIRTVACGHPFCTTCWTAYISISISDGPGCLSLRCPFPSCGVAVGVNMVNMLVSDEDKKKYHRYLLRSYIEDNKNTKWCPSPGCDCAVELHSGSETYDVSCRCSYGFCWNCAEEAHRPVKCETVSKWILKNSAESENVNWILANSKPCPRCKRPIEKNHGCMHMTCMPPCKFEFCWLCLGQWSDHGDKTGGFYACNKYEAAKQQGVYDEAESRKEMAKKCLERYTHYYERWATNQSSKQKALVDLHQMENVHLEKLRQKQRQPESQLKCIIEAWQQIVECRRVLKWSYAYGYYIPEREHAKRVFFEYLQGEAEAGLERLHHCAEKELQTHLMEDTTKEAFNNFRTKLACLTSVTRIYFENLVRALENGLTDVNVMEESSKATSSNKVGETSSKRGKKGRVTAARTDNWSCDQCSYINIEKATTCLMCSNTRPT